MKRSKIKYSLFKERIILKQIYTEGRYQYGEFDFHKHPVLNDT